MFSTVLNWATNFNNIITPLSSLILVGGAIYGIKSWRKQKNIEFNQQMALKAYHLVADYYQVIFSNMSPILYFGQNEYHQINEEDGLNSLLPDHQVKIIEELIRRNQEIKKYYTKAFGHFLLMSMDNNEEISNSFRSIISFQNRIESNFNKYIKSIITNQYQPNSNEEKWVIRHNEQNFVHVQSTYFLIHIKEVLKFYFQFKNPKFNPDILEQMMKSKQLEEIEKN